MGSDNCMFGNILDIGSPSLMEMLIYFLKKIRIYLKKLKNIVKEFFVALG